MRLLFTFLFEKDVPEPLPFGFFMLVDQKVKLLYLCTYVEWKMKAEEYCSTTIRFLSSGQSCVCLEYKDFRPNLPDYLTVLEIIFDSGYS